MPINMVVLRLLLSDSRHIQYNSIDDKIDDFHYLTTFIKFGIGRATHDASQEIRSGEIDREEGVALVHKFDGEFPERFSKEIFQYLASLKNNLAEQAKALSNPSWIANILKI